MAWPTPVKIITALAVVALIHVMSVVISPAGPSNSCALSHSFQHSVLAPQNHISSRKLRLLIPINERFARKESSNFCKTVFSALVHGYEPTLLNWNLDGDSNFMKRMKVLGMP